MEIPLTPGERLVFYTDGLTEARNGEQKEFEEDGLIRSLETHKAQPLPELLAAVVSDAVEFAGSPTFEDDVCVLGIHYAGG
jgi:sigma-B regulation protein RsbU (phosphoserine phosphatase)